MLVPASWVEAGERVKIMDYEGGKVFVLRLVDYNAETGQLQMTPDLPPDSLEIRENKVTAGLI